MAMRNDAPSSDDQETSAGSDRRGFLRSTLVAGSAAASLVGLAGNHVSMARAQGLAASNLPEDQPLPAAVGAPINVNTGNFDTQYASAAAGNHLVLANGSYGSKTLNRSFPTNNRLVIRAQNPLGATFTRMTISGSRQILSRLNIDAGSTNTTSTACFISGSNIRVTRTKIANGRFTLNFGAAVTDILIDHCDITRSRQHMFNLADPKDQQRITVARCWCHDMIGGDQNLSHCFAWAGENKYREKAVGMVARFNHCGPGLTPNTGRIVSSDWVHNKMSKASYIFNYFEQGGGGVISNRWGLRNRWVGNFIDGTTTFIQYDDLCWIYGNRFGKLQCPAGRSHYYDDTKNLAGAPNNSVGGFHASKRTRISGNSGTIELGALGQSSNWCTNPNPDPATLPDPLACGGIKQARSFNGINYAADSPTHPDVGIKIRAHSGSIVMPPTPPAGCTVGSSWVQNLSNQPSNPSPTSPNWKNELFAEFPWIEAVCPDPTSLTGGRGGASPWSIGQNISRGDVAITATRPNCGPRRPGGAGLP